MLQYIILQEAKGGSAFSPLPMLLIIVVVFFFMIWPQMRKQKKAKQYFSQLQKGDKVVTTGGIHGKIASVAETTFVIETEEGRIKIEKGAVSMDMTQAAYKTTPAEEKSPS